MLSEEEKKAIKYFYNLRATIDESYMLFVEEINVKCGKDMIKQITLVLNLITKLQKEVEHQKEKRENQKEELAILNEKQKEMNKLINDVKTYKGQFKRQEKEIKKLQKENEEKNKQINLMAEYIANRDNDEDICKYQVAEWCEDEEDGVLIEVCRKCIKQYFERKVKNVKNKR